MKKFFSIFYPLVDQMDEDADLVTVRGRAQSARGEIVFIEGRVTDQNCSPVEGVLVEIWQACESGRYNHRSDPNPAPLDPDFQYWGQAITNADGLYRFRTIIPGAYPASATWMRPPHIHFKVSKLGFAELITQMYFSGEVFNDSDLILQALSKENQDKVIIDIVERDDLDHPVGVFPIQIQRLVPA